MQETRLSPDEFVYPLFVAPESLPNAELPAMSRFSVEDVVRETEELLARGVSAVILFGIPEEKDEEATGAWEDEGIVQRALRELRPRFPELLLLTDVPGVLDKSKKLIPELSVKDARKLIADGTISGGMIPKVETCIYALEQGVQGVVGSVGFQVGRHDHRLTVSRVRVRDVACPAQAGQGLGDLRHRVCRAEHAQVQHRCSLGRVSRPDIT